MAKTLVTKPWCGLIAPWLLAQGVKCQMKSNVRSMLGFTSTSTSTSTGPILRVTGPTQRIDQACRFAALNMPVLTAGLHQASQRSQRGQKRGRKSSAKPSAKLQAQRFRCAMLQPVLASSAGNSRPWSAKPLFWRSATKCLGPSTFAHSVRGGHPVVDGDVRQMDALAGLAYFLHAKAV